MTRRDEGQANLTAILIVLGLVVAGVWIWKRLPLDTQDYIIDQAIPLAAAILAVGALVWTVARRVRRHAGRRKERARLMGAFERATSRDKRLELAFAMIEANDYRIEGLEPLVPALRELLTDTVQRALGDKQHRIRGMSASYVGVLQDKSVVPLLIKALEDDHAYVRSCAALGLGRLRATEAKEVLEKVKEEDWDQTVRSRAREALERMK